MFGAKNLQRFCLTDDPHVRVSKGKGMMPLREKKPADQAQHNITYIKIEEMIKLSFIIAFILMVFASLIAGLFFSFSIAVSPGLKHLSDIEFLKAMKSINTEILNPLFYSCFFSPLLLFPVTIYLQHNFSSNGRLLILGFLFYFLVILITAAVNVPLNNQLEKFDLLNASQKELNRMRHIFENRWTLWNNIRTVLSAASLIFLILSQLELRK